MLTKLSLIQLYNSRSHIGYSRDSYYKMAKNFIFAAKVDYFILNVVKTLLNLKLALWHSFYVAVYSNKLLFIHHNSDSFICAFGLVFRVLGHFSLKTKWRSGTLTNFRRIRKHYRYLYIKYIKDYNIYKNLTFFTYYNKKLAPQLCDFLFIRRLPSLVVILSAFDSDIALRETFSVRIPSVGFYSNRSLPYGLTFPILSNDISVFTFSYYLFLYKNLFYKALYYRRLDFFNNLSKKIYNYIKIIKTFKLLNFLIILKINKSKFFKNNLYKYRKVALKHQKKKKKSHYKLFVKFRRKKFYIHRKFFFFFRKEKKKSKIFLKILFSEKNYYFLTKTFEHVKSLNLQRKIFFFNVFYELRYKKHYRFLKNIKKTSARAKKLNSIFFKKNININNVLKKNQNEKK